MSSETTRSDLTALGDRLVGTWKVSGEIEGETRWEWMEGGFFLIQRGWTRREGVKQTLCVRETQFRDSTAGLALIVQCSGQKGASRERGRRCASRAARLRAKSSVSVLCA
jgi:hypothetical protein